MIDVSRSLDDSALRFRTNARTTRQGSAETTRRVAVPLGGSLRRARSASCLRRAEYSSPLRNPARRSRASQRDSFERRVSFRPLKRLTRQMMTGL